MQLRLSPRSALASFALVGIGMLAHPSSWHGTTPSAEVEAIAARLAALESALPGQDLEHLKVLLKHMSVVQLDTGAPEGEDDPTAPSTATTIRLTGVNLQIVNGLNATNGNPSDRSSTTSFAVNGVGNLIVGYNESRDLTQRTGSHNLIVGTNNQFTAFGGIVAGYQNTMAGPWSAVTGGRNNVSASAYSSVSGGRTNVAAGESSAVNGGVSNRAIGAESSVCGGAANRAYGVVASVSGGRNNEARGTYSSVSGGRANMANGLHASISGGQSNQADGDFAIVCGGSTNVAAGNWSTVAGGTNNAANATTSCISGGNANIVSAAATSATVSGGCGLNLTTSCAHQ